MPPDLVVTHTTDHVSERRDRGAAETGESDAQEEIRTREGLGQSARLSTSHFTLQVERSSVNAWCEHTNCKVVIPYGLYFS